MSKKQIKQLIENRMHKDGVMETGIKGVQLFRVTEPLQCAPVIYEPTVVAIVNGSKEAILDGHSHVYDSRHYLCCSLSMPAEAGAPDASPDNPLLGVSISLDTTLMSELAITLERAIGTHSPSRGDSVLQGLTLARWDAAFTEALLRLLQLVGCTEDIRVLGKGRLRELYYTILRGDAGDSTRHAFGVGNAVARAIDLMSSHLDEAITIDEITEKNRDESRCIPS
jgi:hypothetical protein